MSKFEFRVPCWKGKVAEPRLESRGNSYACFAFDVLRITTRLPELINGLRQTRTLDKMGGGDDKGRLSKIDLIKGYKQIALSAKINIQRRKSFVPRRSKPRYT